MPISSDTSRVQYVGNASTVTPYVVPFYFLDNADVTVVLTDADGVETTLTETTHYVLSGSGDESGGSLVTVSAYASTVTLTIYREPEETQTTEFVGTGALPAAVITRSLDKLTMLVQSLGRKVGRCLRLSDSSDALAAKAGANRETTVLGFDGAGEAKFYDSDELLSLLSLGGILTGDAPTTFWADAGARALKVPDFNHQFGVQYNDPSIWISTGTSAGNWTPYIIDEDAMTSNSDLRPPSQQSVKAYADALSAFATTKRVKGRNTAGAGAAEEVSLTQLLDWIGSAAQGDLLYRGASAWERLGAGTVGQILKTGGAGANPSYITGGKTAQVVVSNSTAVGSTAVAIPYDNTIPQITEGAEWQTVTITPTNASSTLLIEFNAVVDNSTAGAQIVTGALFVDSTANALAAAGVTIEINTHHQILSLRHSLTAGSTTARTYRLRYGSASGTAYINQTSGGAKYGGVMNSVLRVTEILP